jgi:hypothetical protein
MRYGSLSVDIPSAAPKSMSPTERATKRERRIRRELQLRERHRDWVLKRLGLEGRPGKILELRELLKGLSDPLDPPRSGIAWQESFLPRPDGPPDCFYCQVISAALVPVEYQRLFEAALRLEVRGKSRNPNLRVWDKLVRSDGDIIRRNGRGQIAIARFPHSEHVDLYQRFLGEPGSRPGPR